MAEFEIACPHHGKAEKIVVPAAYVAQGFEGETRCGAGADSEPIKIKIEKGALVGLKRS